MPKIPNFRNLEKEKYLELKSELFSKEAQAKGTYRHHQYDFCLADGHSDENLHSSFRLEAIKYFADRHIPWHDGCNDRRLPSNHLCCSQSSCVNFLFPMVTNEKLLTHVFKQIYPELKTPLQMVVGDVVEGGDYPYMSFEWIGLEDYLGETNRKPGKRTRGAHYTSADFAFRFKRDDGKIQIVLGEWKYTEYYSREDKGENQVRIRNYQDAFYRSPGVFRSRVEGLYRSFFFEPFYQLMRLQLLVQEMEYHHEIDADIVTVLHVSPIANREFREGVTSTYLGNQFPGQGVMDIWKKLVDPSKFISVSIEDMLGFIGKSGSVADKDWVSYLQERYSF